MRYLGSLAAYAVLITAVSASADDVSHLSATEAHDKGYQAFSTGDYATAMRLFRLAADQGDVSSQYDLGLMYAKGLGVSKDYVLAVRWFRLASDQGYAPAEYSLGVAYETGEGTDKDLQAAKILYGFAAAQGDKDAAKAIADLATSQITLFDPPPGTLAFQYMQAAAQTAVPCAPHVIQTWGYLYTMQNHPNGYGDDFVSWRYSGQSVYEAAEHCGGPYFTMLTILRVPAADLQARELNRRNVDLDVQMLRSGLIVASP